MLNVEKTYKVTTDCINCLPLVWIACPQDNHGVGVIMAPINEEQEECLDNGEIVVVRDQFDRTFIITPKYCYAYGQLDLSPKSEDIQKLVKADFFRNLNVNIIVYTVYDYKTHTVTADVAGGRWYETDNIETYLPFLHGKLGKPERVAIFRVELDAFKVRKVSKTTRNKPKHNVYGSLKDYRKYKSAEKRKAKVSNLQFKIKKKV